ncbi:glyoxalase superfamily protein [Amnibacterium sp.]|uniref:glyoxalase superfamily protein n=1 Tax=Amnibacterium sp. TaxID=1872496 RepID=UPI00261797E7|nr:glyoxalase superfamily protein [Amnibacterium sp.]MCU1472917.1 glyoxalase [Amnibacterium sp.]
MRARIEVVTVPVSDPDVAKEFYVDRLGFTLDHDQTVSEEIRFLQVTPPGSACSIAFGRGLSTMQPGSLSAVMMVVDDADAARAELLEARVQVSEVDEQAWGRFVTFDDPDGNHWTLQQLPARR